MLQKIVMICFLGLVIALTPSWGQNKTTSKSSPKTTKSKVKKTQEPVKCIISGEPIADVNQASFSDYQGKRYYFCCPNCKAKFDADPAKYSSGKNTKPEQCNDDKAKTN